MIVCIANPMKSTEVELLKELNKFAGYKTNIQKFLVFLYTYNKCKSTLENQYYLQYHQI